MKKKFGALLVLAIGMMIAATGCGKEKVELNDYVAINGVGYDGYGGLQSNIDIDELSREIYLNTDDKDISQVDVANMLQELSDSDNLYVEFDKTNGLKNGDKVSYEWRVDSEIIEKKTGVKLNTDGDTVKVEGLKEPADFDIMRYLAIKEEGASSKGKLNVKGSDEFVNWPEFSIKNNGKLSNGDEVTITIGSEEEFELFRSLNYLPEFDRKISYTVSGLANYITGLDDFEGEVLAKLDEKCQSELNNGDMADLYTDFELYGLGWISDKNSGYNYLNVLYKAISISDGNEIILYNGFDVEHVTDVDILSESKHLNEFLGYSNEWFTAGSIDEYKEGFDKSNAEFFSLNRELEIKTF